jgi:hypothetical protein
MLDLYCQAILAVIALTAAMVLEELVFERGDMVRFKCPECGGEQDILVKDPKESMYWDRDVKGRQHPRREMMARAVVKSSQE